MPKRLDMRCPCCEKPLEVTHRERYQDLSEHVSDPNREPSMKDGYQCPNKFCIANNLRCTWIEDGDIFIHPPKGISYVVASDTIKNCSVSGTTHALDTWGHYYEIGKIKKKKRTKDLYLFKWMIKIEPKDKGWKYPENERYNPSWWKYSISFYEKSGECYISIIPFLTMLRFVIKKFHSDYESWIYNKVKNKFSFDQCIELISGKNSFETEENKLYRKMARIWIITFYPEKCKELIGHLKEKQS